MIPVVFRKRARDDFHDIADYIARDNQARALTFVDELERVTRSLSANPERATLAPEIGDGVRRLTHAGYNIFYRPTPDRIVILRILHGARDPLKHL